MMEMAQSDRYSYSLRSSRPQNVNNLPSTLTATLTYFFFGDSVDSPEDPKSAKHTLFPREFAWF